jgi:hypothetical protein
MHMLHVSQYLRNNKAIMQDREYREALIEAVHTLNNAQNEVFTAMVNIGFKGTYKEISEAHEVGDVLNLELSMFENTGDQNLDSLVEAIVSIVRAQQKLINLNDLPITEDDLD